MEYDPGAEPSVCEPGSTPAAQTARVRTQIERIYRDVAVFGEDGARYSICPLSVTPQRGAFIRDLCRAEGPRATLEIGMAWGLSTLFILEALAAGGQPFSHTVIDPFQTVRFHGSARRCVRESGMADSVEIIEEFSRIALARLASAQRSFDFVFIDGGHRFEDVFVDLVFADQMLKPGGAMVFDDTWSDPVFLTCRFAETNFNYEAIAEFQAHSTDPARARRRRRLGGRPQLRALRKPRESSTRKVFEFAPFFTDFAPDYNAQQRRLAEQGLAALRAGERGLARRAFVQMLRHDPYCLKTWSRLLRCFFPAALARGLSSRSARPNAAPDRSR